MKNIAFILLFFGLALLCSCSSDDVKISENYIEVFAIDGINPIEINIKNNQSLIYIWTDSSLYDSLKNRVPWIEVSEGAKISKSKSDPLAWSDSDFKYTVTAENGYTREYSVEIDTVVPRMYSFNSWILSEGSSTYYIPSSLRWASGNAGIAMALAILKKDVKDPEKYPTKKTEDGYNGSAVLMETLEGGVVFGRDIRLFSGNFFLGKFNVSKAISDELAATELGYIYPAKPDSIKGFYKYKEGPGNFIGFEDPNRPDSCSMNAWLYQSDSPSSGKDTVLTVGDIDKDTLGLVIAKASLSDCSDTGGKFKEFKLKFEYNREPEFEKYNYKLGVTFAASKYGDLYAGKIGTRLIVDEIEILDY
jgi:hypothetical protein